MRKSITILERQYTELGLSKDKVTTDDMLFTLEPTVLMGDDDFSVLCEEDIHITENGAEFISHRQESLVLIG